MLAWLFRMKSKQCLPALLKQPFSPLRAGFGADVHCHPMFTGIIEAKAIVMQNSLGKFILSRPEIFTDIKIGSSISVSGVCLTIVKFDDVAMTFNIIEETFQKSKLGTLRRYDKVNLERAMKASDRFDGHVVQGHVEGVGIVTDLTPPPLSMRGEGGLVIVKVPTALQRFVLPKGSISLDGVSLTVAEIEGEKITVALIPHTLQNTTLGSLKEGDRVNIETDVLLRGLSMMHTHSVRTKDKQK